MRRRSFLAALATGAAATVAAPAVVGRSRAAQSTELSPSGTLDAPGVSEAVVDEDGQHVYGAAYDSLLVADFGDPSSPATVTEVEATIDGESLTGVQDVAVSGNRALVAGPPGFVRDGQVGGAVLFDVSDPAAPEQVATIPTSHSVHNAHLDGDTAYLTGTMIADDPVLVYDVADDDPEQVGRWSIIDAAPDWSKAATNAYSCHDVYADGDRLYVAYWDGGTWILDVGDPSNPTNVAWVGGIDPESYGGDIEDFVQLPGNSHYARPSPDGDLLAIGREAWDRDRGDDRYGGPGSIDVYDLSDETDPSFVTALRPPVVQNDEGRNHVDTAHNFGFRGRTLYASWYTGGVRVYDLSTPSEPQTVGWWASPDEASFWTARPLDEGFVASAMRDPSASDDANQNYGESTLYAFADPSGDAATPAQTLTVDETGMPESPPNYDLPAPTTTPETTAAPETTTPTTRPPTSAATTAAPTTDAPATTDATTDGSDGSSGGGAPGFGVGAAVAGAALAAYHRLGRDEN